MLMQLHHQRKTKPFDTKFIGQRKVLGLEDWWRRVREMNSKNPPPKGWDLLSCDERSRHFVKAVSPSEATIIEAGKEG